MSVKIIEDTMPNAEGVLRELLSLCDAVSGARVTFLPFGQEQRKAYGTLPKYIVATIGELGKYKEALKNFNSNYPFISAMVANGSSDGDGMFRLHDGVYKLGQFNEQLEAKKYAVKLDVDRAKMCELASNVLADFVVFTITQYKLHKLDSGVLLSVSNLCGSKGVSADVLYGSLLQMLEDAGETPYGYEAISPYRDDLIDMDAVFVAECEEANFPLTADICTALLDGKMDITEARGKVYDWMKQVEKKTIENMTPSNMMKRMKLE